MKETKIKKLKLREIVLLNSGIEAVAGLSFPMKIKYRLAKIQNQTAKSVADLKVAREQMTSDTISKFKLKKDDDTSDYVFTFEANKWLGAEVKKVLDGEEEITGGIFPFVEKDLQDMEDWAKEWNEDIKTKEQPSLAIPNNFYTCLFPIIVGMDDKE